LEPIVLGRHDEKFLDGGAGCNNPSGEVYSAAIDVWRLPKPSNFNDSIVCIVSIDTGIYTDTKFGLNWSGLAATLANIVTDSEVITERFRLMHGDLRNESPRNSRYSRFNIAGGLGEIGLHAHKKMGEIYATTRDYWETQSVFEEMKACADKLAGGKRAPLPRTQNVFQITFWSTNLMGLLDIARQPSDSGEPCRIFEPFIGGQPCVLFGGARRWHFSSRPSISPCHSLLEEVDSGVCEAKKSLNEAFGP